MNPVHVVLELLQILDVSVTDLADDEASFALLSGLPRSGLILLLRRRVGSHHAGGCGVVALAHTLQNEKQGC